MRRLWQPPAHIYPLFSVLIKCSALYPHSSKIRKNRLNPVGFLKSYVTDIMYPCHSFGKRCYCGKCHCLVGKIIHININRLQNTIRRCGYIYPVCCFNNRAAHSFKHAKKFHITLHHTVSASRYRYTAACHGCRRPEITCR